MRLKRCLLVMIAATLALGGGALLGPRSLSAAEAGTIVGACTCWVLTEYHCWDASYYQNGKPPDGPCPQPPVTTFLCEFDGSKTCHQPGGGPCTYSCPVNEQTCN